VCKFQNVIFFIRKDELSFSPHTVSLLPTGFLQLYHGGKLNDNELVLLLPYCSFIHCLDVSEICEVCLPMPVYLLLFL